MIRVHHLNNSRSQRVLWLLEELELPYEVVRYERDAKTMLAPQQLREIHPMGKSPVLEEDGMVLAESGAIVEHLVERHGPHLAPAPGAPERARYLHWMHYAEGSAMPPLLLGLVISRMGPLGWPARKFVRGRIEEHLDYMEQALAGSDWFVGQAFSAADVQMSFPLQAAAARGGLDQGRPRLWSFLQRIQTRPAFQRAFERGGPFALLR
jgi:glutathione S-transferase